MPQRAQIAGAGPASEVSPGELSERLDEVLALLPGAAAEDRPRLAGQLNALLRRVHRGDADAEATARLILSALEQRHLEALADPAGAPSRSEAVAALLRLGYPWALQVDWDDLAFLRAHAGRRSRRLRLLLAGAVALLLALGLAAGLVVPRLQGRAGPPRADRSWLSPPPAAPEVAPRILARSPSPLTGSAAQRAAGREVRLRVDLDERGEVAQVTVLGGAGDHLDEVARQVVGRFRFSPGLRDGQPVPSSTIVTYRFGEP